MSVNRYQPHVQILPEDDANRQIVVGFQLDPFLSHRSIHVLEVAGGWLRVLELFELVHCAEMRRNLPRHMVLVLDLDGHAERLEQVKERIPDDLKQRVFVLGVLTEPEKLRAKLGKTYEAIGQSLAKDCRENSDATWRHALLQHNAAEVDRLRETVRPILFP